MRSAGAWSTPGSIMLTQTKPDLHNHPADLADVAPSLRGAQVLVTGGTGFIGGRLVERLLIECHARPRVIVRKYARAASLARCYSFPV